MEKLANIVCRSIERNNGEELTPDEVKIVREGIDKIVQVQGRELTPAEIDRIGAEPDLVIKYIIDGLMDIHFETLCLDEQTPGFFTVGVFGGGTYEVDKADCVPMYS